MSVPSITVDLERLLPLDCTPAFSVLLGYPSETQCLSKIDQINHFKGYNLLQLAALKPAAAANTVEIIDRQFAAVGRVARITLDDTGTLMTVDAEPKSTGKHTLDLPDTDRFEPYQPLLERCLQQEGVLTGWHLETTTAAFSCSICARTSGQAKRAIRIVIPDYRPGLNERLALLDRDYSLQQLGRPSAWRLLFRYLHQAGHHVNIAVDADAALVLTLSWPEHRHG